MAEDPGSGSIKVTFNQLFAQAQEISDKLSVALEKAVAIGDEEEVARIRVQQGAISNVTAAGARGTPAITESTAALEKENAASAEGVALEARRLTILQEQRDLRLEMARESGALTQRPGQLPIVTPPAHEQLTAFDAPVGVPIARQIEQQSALETLAKQQAAQDAAQAEAIQAQNVELERQAQLRAQILAEASAASSQVGALQGVHAQVPAQLLGRANPGQALAAAGLGPLKSSEAATLALNEQTARYGVLASEGAAQTDVFAGDLSRLGLVQTQASNQMRAHGALTTEFISALARGETTIQEFGYQISATIGKFAGWTAAAAATYGALEAIKEIGTGAIDSASGVQQLTRTIDNVNAQKAAEQFRMLSADANVSLKDAANAVFLFSRTFHAQDDAVAAARIGLQAYTLDGVQLADTVQLLTAVHQHFGDSVKQLGGDFDVLALGQQQYNARISQTIPLLAASIGALKNAGTSENDALQLAIYAQRTTQASGPQLGTALARSASTFVGKTASQQDFAILGLPGEEAITNYGAFLKLAIQKALTYTPEQRALLSTAFGGGLIGSRIFSRLFSGGSEALNAGIIGPNSKLTPQNAAGTAEAEEKKRLAQADQQLAALGNNLQRLGSALGETQLPFGIILSAMNEFLTTLTSLADAFGKLPGGVKESIEAVLALTAASKFSRHTQIGGSVNELAQRYNIPGANSALFAPSEADKYRQGQTTGARTGLANLDTELAQSTAAAGQLSAKTLILKSQLTTAAMNLEESAGDAELTAQYSAQVDKLTADVNRNLRSIATLEEEAVSTQEVRAIMANRLVALEHGTLTNSQLRAEMSGETAIAMDAELAAEGRVTATLAERLAMFREQAMLSLASGAAAAKGMIPGMGGGAAAEEESGGFFAKGGGIGGALITGLIAQTAASTLGGALGGSLGKQVQGSSTEIGVGASAGFLAGGPMGAALGAGLGFIGTKIASELEKGKAAELANASLPQFNHTETAFSDFQDAMLKKISQAGSGGLSLGQVGGLKSQLANMLKDPDFAPFVSNLKQLQAALDNVTKSTAQAAAASKYGELIGTGAQPSLNLGEIESTGNRAASLGLTKSDLNSSAQRMVELSQGLSNPTTLIANLKDLQTAQTKYLNMISTGAKLITDQATANPTISGNETALRQSSTLFNNALDPLQKSYNIVKEQLRRRQAELAAAEKQQQQEVNADPVAAPGQPGSSTDPLEARITLLKMAMRADAENLTQAGKAINQTTIQVKLLQQQQRDTLTQNIITIQDSENALKTSQIQGTGPAADLARQQSALQGMVNDLATLKSNSGTAAEIRDQETKINNARTALATTQQSEASTLVQQIQAYIQARSALAQSQTLDPIKQSEEQLSADQQSLALIQRKDYQNEQLYQTAKLQAQTKVNTDKTNTQQAIISQDQASLAFENHIGKIGDQQYIDGLKNILATKKLALSARQQILQNIYDLEHNTGTIDLNVGNIKIPTIYDVRKAISNAKSGVVPGQQNMTVVNSPTVQVTVSSSKDAPAVGAAIDKVLGTSVKSAMRAKGVR